MCNLAAVVTAPLCDRHWEAFDMAEIVEAVAVHYHLSASAIYDLGRTPRPSRARQVAMFLIRSKLKLSYPRIGKFMGRDHTTIISACRAIGGRLHQTEIAAIFLNLRQIRQYSWDPDYYAKAAAA